MRSPKAHLHRCGATVITGLTGDRCALVVMVDAEPLNRIGEVAALSDGRRTFQLRGQYLQPRDHWNIPGHPPSHDLPVVAEHRCGEKLSTVCYLPPPAALAAKETSF